MRKEIILLLGLVMISCISAQGLIVPETAGDVDVSFFTGNLTNLSEMQDTNIPTPSNNEVLTWSASTSKWIAQATAIFSKWIVDSSGGFLYNDADTIYFNNTLLNDTIDDRAVTTETDPVYTSENSTIARIGDCPSGQLVQNITTGGVECSATAGDITNVQGDDIYIYNGSDSGDVVLVLNETRLNATIDDRDADTTYDAGSNITLTGTTFSLNTTGVLEWLNNVYQVVGNYLTSADEPNLNVNSSNYWDGLDTPSDIDGSQINNDLNWINFSDVNNGTFLTEETDPLWTANQSSYSTTAEILAFGYYNATDFVITDYFTKSDVLGFGYYNSTDFNIADYFTSSEVLAFNYYNSSDFDINDYFTSAEVLGFSYYNSTDFSISDYVPYTGATANLDLGNYNVSANTIDLDYGNSIMINGNPYFKADSGGGGISLGFLTAYPNDYSTFIGDRAGLDASATTYITAFGESAARRNSQNSITAIGYYALSNNTGTLSTAVGHYAGYNQSGDNFVGVGQSAGNLNTGDRTTAIGYAAGNTNTGERSTFVGYNSGKDNTGNYSSGFGAFALNQNDGDHVTSIGYAAGYDATGDNGVYIGYKAGYQNAVANQFIVRSELANSDALITGDFGTGNIIVNENVTATYFLGDGSQLTNIDFIESDPLWTANQSSYSTTAEILAFGYYNATDFVITDYFTKSEIEGFNYYNATDFVISDYFTSSEVLSFNYYNSTDFLISDYFTSAQILGFNYYNSTDFVITDYYTKTQIDNFDYYNITDFDIDNYYTKTETDTEITNANTSIKNYVDSNFILQSEEGNLNVNSSNYWDDLDTINATQMEDNSGTLNIKESWFTALWNTIFGTKTTDDLTEGSVNLYDNSSWNESGANGLYVNVAGDTMTGDLSMGNLSSITDIEYIDWNLTATPTNQEGRTYFDQDAKTITTMMDGGEVTLNHGLENLKWIKNNCGYDMYEGQVVYETGALGNIATACLADKDDSETFHILGIVTQETIPNNQNGWITTMGDINNIDTTGTPYGETWADGDKLYLNSGGNLSNIHPSDPTSATIIVAKVKRAHATIGSISSTTIDAFTIGNNYNGTLRQSVINKNASGGASFTAVNNLGHRTSLSIFGSEHPLFANVSGLYSEGYGDAVFINDGAKDFIWYTDPTDSHNYSFLTNEIMRLTANGNLNVSGLIYEENTLLSDKYYGIDNPFGYYNSTDFDINDYFTSAEVLGFDYYNSTDFSIGDYYTSSQIDGFSYYNATNFVIGDYSTTAEILAFGYYNATDFVITDYFTKSEVLGFSYYNATDFSIGDYSTTSEVLAFNYYNSTDFVISDYFTSAQILGFDYYNSTDFVISDYYTKTEIDNFGYYNITDFDIANYYTKTETDTEITNANTSMKNYVDGTFLTSFTETDPYWTANQSSYFTKNEVLGFSYYNATDFSVGDYSTKAVADTLYAPINYGDDWNKTYADTLYYGIGNPSNFYNSTDFDYNDYYLKSNPFSFYNSTTIPDYMPIVYATNNTFYPYTGNPSGFLTSYTETDPLWTGNQSSYSTTADILGFGYYNSSDFSIGDYYTSSQIEGFNYYNSTDFSIGDYSTTTEAGALYYSITNPSGFYNATDFSIGNYYTSSQIDGFNYYNATDFSIGDYSTTTEANTLYASKAISLPAANITIGTFGTGSYVFDTNVTMEKLVFENDAGHYIEDNSTCIKIYGDTSILEIC